MKILFFCPDYFEIYRVIEDGMLKHKDSQVKSVIFNGFKYKNVFQKVLNFLFKFLFKVNLKKKWASKYYISSISENDQFDFLVVICPDFLLLEDLLYLKKRAKKSVVFYWDSFDNIPRYLESLSVFDEKYTFEPKDTLKYNIKFLPNFYYSQQTDESSQIIYDVFFIGTFDERITVLVTILDYLKNNHKKTTVTLKYSRKATILDFKRDEINFINKSIPILDAQHLLKQSKIILDIQKDIQQGLTFRVFESLGFKKKLITTNKDIINYDFYNKNNIFVWDSASNEIPEAFFESPYEDVPEAILEKYSLKNWVNTILS